ncbi:hypothetical protein Lfu02_77660 [Longispora fulva]|uniref:Uncharacterized protein n=1 Tax=Longispora fulva TaxID=619741 RepID=A0A8J7GNZ8_9ACTN|nr:hypothetical protein [Longispora fulva]MBG6136214.1 hypothetical protein [Longispora fulva]GIG63394.1 hypothetical protein Lfu02_77660 [Longispora fulva]
MLDPELVTHITTTLTDIEAFADARLGWDAPPRAYGIFTQPDGGGRALLVAAPLPIRESQWHLPDPQRPGVNLSAALVLGGITFQLTEPGAPAWFGRWLTKNGRQLVATAFLFEGYTTSGYAGYTPGDLNEFPAMADAEVRIIAAIDIDGRVWQLVRRRGDSTPELTVMEQPPPEVNATNVIYALARLLAARA